MAIPDHSEEGDRDQDRLLGERLQLDISQNLTLRIGDNSAAGSRRDVSIREPTVSESVFLHLRALIVIMIKLLLAIFNDASGSLHSPQAPARQAQNPGRSTTCSPTQTWHSQLSEHACCGQNDTSLSRCLSMAGLQSDDTTRSNPVLRTSSHHSNRQEARGQLTQPVMSRLSNECPCDQQPSAPNDQKHGSDESIDSNVCEQSEVSYAIPSSLSATGKPNHKLPKKKAFLVPNPSIQNEHHVNTEIFYSGTNGRETCFFCHGRVRIYDNLDPLEDHARRFPECLFIRWRYGKPGAVMSSGEVKEVKL